MLYGKGRGGWVYKWLNSWASGRSGVILQQIFHTQLLSPRPTQNEIGKTPEKCGTDSLHKLNRIPLTPLPLIRSRILRVEKTQLLQKSKAEAEAEIKGESELRERESRSLCLWFFLFSPTNLPKNHRFTFNPITIPIPMHTRSGLVLN